ncbi:MAG: DNA-protecting protein DprA [Eggerthellaceae bacterium]|nr:DNA-protecting protein DprA [Eggerthellaceae bacterium]
MEEKLERKAGLSFEIPCDDPFLYPRRLRGIDDPPEALMVLGDPTVLGMRSLVVVGARRATPYGLACARRFATIAAELGYCIVSGGARGIDAEAHRAALDACGRTVAVLGGGADVAYPPENAGLFVRIADGGGALVSERPWGDAPKPFAFRARNRIIAALADAVLVCEAGLPSGTFSLCDEALAAGKPVLCVPGAITSPASTGPNYLLTAGGIPVVDDRSFSAALKDASDRSERRAS